MAESSLDGDVDPDFAAEGLHWRVVCLPSKVLEKFARQSEMERLQAALNR
jgi:hypothetical protein